MSPIAAPFQRRLHRSARPLPAAALTFLAWLIPGGLLAGESSVFGPGPEAISPEEAAIAADPAAGIEHGVILVEETEQIDDLNQIVAGEAFRSPSRLRYHLRAKVLSNEARDLGNVTIHLPGDGMLLEGWWGFTLHPDGTVRHLHEEDLHRRTILSSEDGVEAQVLTALLPAVGPGTIIDYGYDLAHVRVEPWRAVSLQRRWPVRRLQYRWRPWHLIGLFDFAGACSIRKAGVMEIGLSQEEGSFVIRAENLPPLVEEPWMPAVDAAGATALLYYTHRATDSGAFWDRLARQESKREKRLFEAGALKRIRKEIGLGGDVDPVDGLRRAYDWIAVNVENLGIRSPEDLASFAGKEDEVDPGRSLRRIVESKRATEEELDLLFLGLARSLGVDGRTVLAADRREHPWDPGLLAIGQFDERLVAVRLPGSPESKLTLVDAGSGLGFGEVPWWLSGALGMAVAGDRHEVLRIEGTSSAANVSESEVEIDLPAGPSGGASLRWSRRTKGQHGLVERRSLHSMSPGDRSRRMEEICRGGSEIEILQADAREIEKASGGLSFECRGESEGGLERWDDEGVHVGIDGPWIEPVPHLPSGTRIHAVELPFPCTDIATVRIRAPEGFTPEPLPRPIRLEGPFGSYFLQAQALGGAWTLQRSLKLLHQRLEPDRAPGLKKFLDEVRQADRMVLTFHHMGAEPR